MSLVNNMHRASKSSFHAEPAAVTVSSILHEGLPHDVSSIPHKKIKRICCIGAGYVVSYASFYLSLQHY